MIKSFRTFTRTWWKETEDYFNYPDGREPSAGKKRYYQTYNSEEEAREACRIYNESNNPGRLSRMMEYEGVR